MAWRWTRGLSLYTEPSIHHVAAPYFPFYFMVLGWLYHLTGPAYWVGRLISTASTLVSGILTFWVVKQESRSLLLGLICSGIWFASFGHSGFFFDLNRVDSFSIVFLMAAYVIAFYKPGEIMGGLAGLFLALSVLTKQNHLAFIAPILFSKLIQKDFRGAAALTIVFAGVIFPFIIIYNRASDGWFSLLTLKFIRFTIMPSRIFEFLSWYFKHYAIPTTIILAFIIKNLAEHRWKDVLRNPWLAFWAASFVLSFLFRLPPGGYLNAKMPISLSTAVTVGVLLADLIGSQKELKNRLITFPFVWPLAVAVVCIVAVLYMPFLSQIPAKSEWKAAKNLRKFVSSQQGLVVMPYHLIPEKNVLQLHEISYHDLGNSDWGRKYHQKIQEDLASLKPSMVIADADLRQIDAYKNLVEGMGHGIIDFALKVKMVTGEKFSLQYVYYQKHKRSDQSFSTSEMKQ